MLERLKHELGSRRADLVGANANGGERWLEATGEGHVVEARYGDLRRALNGAFEQNVVRTEGDEIVARRNRRWFASAVEQLAARLRAVGLGERIAHDHELGIELETPVTHRFEESLAAVEPT